MRSIPRLGAASRRPGSRRHAYWRRQGRRLAAAALAALAVLIAAATLRAAAADASPVTVVVVSADLPAGHRLTVDDLQLHHVPSGARPPGALTAVDAVVGRSLAGPITAGEVVTSSRIAPAKGPAGVLAGRVAIALPLANPAVLQMISAGDEVLVLEAGTGTRVTDAIVLQAPTAASAGSGGASSAGLGTLSMAAEQDPALFVAVPESDASRVASAFGPADAGRGFVVAVRP